MFDRHCVKNVRFQSFSGLYFPSFRLNSISPYSVQMWENTDQKNTLWALENIANWLKKNLCENQHLFFSYFFIGQM